MKNVINILIFLIIIVTPIFSADDFYAYYTRLPFIDDISDKHADIVISYGDKGQFVFSRESSYLPYWKSGNTKNFVTERVPRKGDGSGLLPDKYNRHSYVRIIKKTPEEILVHWRYYPDFLRTKMTDVVHETYSFNPEGRIERIVKQGTEKIDDWQSDSGIFVEYISLREHGLSSISQQRPVFKEDTRKVTTQVKDNSIGSPSTYFHFNEGASDSVTEYISGIQYPIRGHKSYWTEGVSGSALQFDGYFSGIEIPGAYSPRISTEFTIEVWIAMAAHPFGWVPIITQSNWKRAGYYLGINAYGEIGFMFNKNGEWTEYKTEERIDINRWYHVAVTLSEKSGKLIIYLDGKPLRSEKIEFEENLMLIHANAPLAIGLNNDKVSPLPSERYTFGQYASLTGFEGVIDEVRILNETLTQEQILESYQKLVPAEENLSDPGFAKRILPGHPGIAEKFGAVYTNLKYHDLWDNAWRSSKYPDILVKFDELPTSVTFWRGPSYGAGWVTENNLWMVDQSVESGNGVSYGEHMSDKQGRYSHVRLIENTDARVIVHWRYALNDVLYSFIKEYGDAGVWIDEYMTIYPDGVGIRKVSQKAKKSELERKPIFWEERPAQKISWQDVQFLAQPGMTPDDVMNLEAVHLANTKGETATMDWSNGVPTKSPLPSANIELINFKSEYKIFLAFPQGIYINPWGRVPEEMYCHFMTWNHWPVAFINSQGKRSLFPSRITHSALCAADNTVDYGNVAMYGFTNGTVKDLVPLVKSWTNPPLLTNEDDCKSLGYDRDQRAYVLIAEDEDFYFDINASSQTPLVNPCFIIKNVENRDTLVKLKIDEKEIQIGKNFRHGVTFDVDGKPMIVIWLKINLDVKRRFEFEL